jgi:hypothetical protein
MVAGIDACDRPRSRNLGDAVGSAVEAFVLYGSAGASVRQVTAQILASIAQQAAVQAIYELAQGLAVLALAFFGVPNAGPSATAYHFAAAATYGVDRGRHGCRRSCCGRQELSKRSGCKGRKVRERARCVRCLFVRRVGRQHQPASVAILADVSDDAYISGSRQSMVAAAIAEHTDAVLERSCTARSMR